MKLINEAHRKEYETSPEVVATAPGRFHLIGEHSWFFKDKTLSMAVDLPIYVAISKRDDTSLRFYYVQLDDRKRSNLSSLKLKKEDKWANAIKAVIYGYTSGGFDLSGMDITIYSDIKPSAGFGVTTAIKTATLIAIKNYLMFLAQKYRCYKHWNGLIGYFYNKIIILLIIILHYMQKKVL